MQPWASIAASSAQTSPGSTRSPGCWKWTLNPRSFSTSMSRSASRIVRLRASSQRCSSGEAVRLRRVGLLGRVRLQPPPIVVERDLPVVSDTFQEAVERIRQAGFQMLDRRGGVDGESGARPERVADLLPLRGGQEEGLEAAEVLRALDGEVAGLDLVADLEEQRAFPAATVRHAVAADERLQRRWGEVDRHIGREAAASRRAVFAVGP